MNASVERTRPKGRPRLRCVDRIKKEPSEHRIIGKPLFKTEEEVVVVVTEGVEPWPSTTFSCLATPVCVGLTFIS